MNAPTVPLRLPVARPRRALAHRVRGGTLIVGMILLLLMTTVSLTSLKAIKTDERLSGNLQDRYQAFQAAEAALRDGELLLELPSLPPFDGNGGMYDYTDDNVPAALDFDDANARAYSQDLTGVARRPLYIVEQMEPGPGCRTGDSLVEGGPPEPQGVPYRITAVGFGASALTRVALQSTFCR